MVSVFERMFKKKIKIVNPSTISNIRNQLWTHREVQRSIEIFSPPDHVNRIDQNNKFIKGINSDGQIEYWPTIVSILHKKIMSRMEEEKSNFKFLSNYEEYFGKDRKCLTCCKTYKLKNNLVRFTCGRPFGLPPNQQKIPSVHSDGISSQYGFLAVPLVCFIVLGVRVPDLNMINEINLVPINVISNQHVSLFKSNVLVGVTKY